MPIQKPRRTLRAPTPKPVTVAPVRSSAAERAKYQRRLDALIDEMHRSLMRWIKAAWRATPPVLAGDASPAVKINAELAKLGRKWQGRFDDEARDKAKGFADGARAHSDRAFRENLKNAGFTVEFQMTPAMRDAYEAVIAENVGLIRSIASEHLTAVQGAVMRGVAAGRDLGAVAKDIEAAYGVTKRRAALIARDQNNKATAVMTAARQQELGITRAVWVHSAGGKHPRPSHVKADGKEYDVARGMLIDGEWIRPGQLINCRCVSRAVIEGFE